MTATKPHPPACDATLPAIRPHRLEVGMTLRDTFIDAGGALHKFARPHRIVGITPGGRGRADLIHLRVSAF